MRKIENVKNLVVADVDRNDYPDFSDAFFTNAEFEDTGLPLTEFELDVLTDLNGDVVNEMAHEAYRG